jgi:hypothetical protein
MNYHIVVCAVVSLSPRPFLPSFFRAFWFRVFVEYELRSVFFYSSYHITLFFVFDTS